MGCPLSQAIGRWLRTFFDKDKMRAATDAFLTRARRVFGRFDRILIHGNRNKRTDNFWDLFCNVVVRTNNVSLLKMGRGGQCEA
jgi:hypothetical protein